MNTYNDAILYDESIRTAEQDAAATRYVLARGEGDLLPMLGLEVDQ